jgi:hypothetical protein
MVDASNEGPGNDLWEPTTDILRARRVSLLEQQTGSGESLPWSWHEWERNCS